MNSERSREAIAVDILLEKDAEIARLRSILEKKEKEITTLRNTVSVHAGAYKFLKADVLVSRELLDKLLKTMRDLCTIIEPKKGPIA